MPPPLPELPGVEHRFETVNGIRIHYAEAGAGDPLVLLHGWPQHWWMWRDWIGPLAERFRVIVPDLRGHGWSDKPPSTYRKTEFLDDAIALLDRLGLARVRFVGHDWGGWTGMLAGLREPERIERLVVMSIPHPWRRRPHPRLLAAALYQPVVGGTFGKLAMQRLGFTRLMLRAGRSIGSFSDAELDVYDAVQRESETAEASVRIYRTFMLHEAAPWARGGFRRERLTVPTLWLVGERDPLASASDDGYRDHADDMTLEFVPDAGHFMPEELTVTLRDRVLAFLSG
jgi:pimeloyl-ACP methyl ester carboxylesterase